MKRRLLGYWLAENGAELLLDLALVAAVIGLALFPPRSQIEVFLHAGIATAVVMRAYSAWRDWRFAPGKLNDIWHRLGRDAGTRAINRIARIYDLEVSEDIRPFEGELGTALLHARQDRPARCGCALARTASKGRMISPSWRR